MTASQQKVLKSISIVFLIITTLIFVWTAFISILTFTSGDAPDLASFGFSDLRKDSLLANEKLQKLASSYDESLSAQEKQAFYDNVIENPPQEILNSYILIQIKMAIKLCFVFTMLLFLIMSCANMRKALLDNTIFNKFLAKLLLWWGIVITALTIIIPSVEAIAAALLIGAIQLSFSFFSFMIGLLLIWFGIAFQHANAIQEEINMVI